MVNLIPKPLENETVNDQLLEETNKVLGNGKKQGKKFAVLLCAEDSEYVKKKYEGYFGVFVRMLGEEGESWDVYRVAGNEFPNEKELGMYDGFVITGSCSDAHSNELWICKLLNLLKVLDSLKKKVLGICFGHQVLELPPQVEVIGRSNKTSVEMFRYGEHMMGIQGHPEYNKDILLHLIDRLLQKNFIVDTYANELRAKFMESRDPDKEAWRKLCVNFLKGKL
ncbi:gamma-glutamyl peptidase 5 isoform X2 [Beta vulgaris subsp. vulgaris]|uniref:gamma-glutamyl peptidase 5 isoform X2 n=1 Tax=Beta vulgaris subsp. vulgaris TaxID=3555 RepID=UPI0025482C20|nr:gamma-glutamyl peptidase 5 isoform X2 [Beta vulgaris subsp. vulgaris]